MRNSQPSLRWLVISCLPVLITAGCVTGEGVGLDPNDPLSVNISVNANPGSGAIDNVPIQQVGGNKPRAIATSSAVAGFAPLSTMLSAGNSSGGSGDLQYAWDLDDGNILSGVLVSHVFEQPGIYDVLLQVTDVNNQSGNAILTIVVVPDLKIVVSGSGAGRTFFVQSDVPLASLFGDYQISWTFGDGSQATGDVVTHTYQSTGSFPVSLSFKTGNTSLQADTLEVAVTSGNGLLIADGGSDLTVYSGDSVTLDATGSIGPAPLAYQWLQIVGPKLTMSGVNSATLSFTAPSVSTTTVAQFQLTVSGASLADIDIVTVQIEPANKKGDTNQSPIADAGSNILVIDEDLNGEEEVILYAGGSSDPDNDDLTYVWTTPFETLPKTTDPNTHVVLPVGVHTIKLEVSDPSGAKQTDTLTATVQAGPGVLAISGATIYFSGAEGGPLSPANIVYTVRNTGDSTLLWALSGLPSWLDADTIAGSLAPGAQTNVSLSTNANALLLAAGLYSGTLVFADNTGDPAQTRDADLELSGASVLNASVVEPAFSGNVGGPFTSSPNTIMLSNSGSVSCNWTLTNLPTWLSADKTSGSLAASGVTTITFTPTAAANSLAAGTYSQTLTFTNTTTNKTEKRDVRITALQVLSYSSGGNISYGWATSAANNAGSGSAAWQNTANASESNDAFTTVTLNNNESQYLVFSNFDLEDDIPADAEITGIEFHVEAMTSNTTPVCTEAVVVKGGVIKSTNLANDEIVGKYEYRGMYYGDDGERWGEPWTAADIESSDFGLAIRVSSTGAETVEVDSCNVLVHWAKTPDAVVQLNHAASPMAPCAIHADVLGSTIGGSTWEKVGVKWNISGPVGWTMTATDPRPGSWGSSRSRDCKTDMWGYNTAIYADLPGTYTIQATLYLEDGTTISDSQQVTVAANTRVKRYIRDDGNDGLDGTSYANAWKTWDHAVSMINLRKTDVELIVQDDDSWQVNTALSNRVWKDLTNVVIRRSGDGTNKPIIEGTSGMTVFALLRLQDVVIDGLDLRGVATPEGGVLGSEGDALRVTMVNVSASQGHASFWEMNSGYPCDQLLIYNCDIQDIHRYGFFMGPDCKQLVFLGTRLKSSTTNPPTGEGMIRVYSKPVNVLWCDFDSQGTGQAALRAGKSYTHCYECNFHDSAFGVGEVYNDHTITSYYIKRYDGNYIEYSSTNIAQERNYYIMLCNNVFNSATNVVPFLPKKKGHHHNIMFVNNTCMAQASNSFLAYHTTEGEVGEATFRDITFANNILAVNTVDNGSGTIMDRPDLFGGSTYVFSATNHSVAENNIGPATLSGTGRWRLESTWFTNPAAVNALPYISNEAVATKLNAPDAGRGLLTSDLLQTNDWTVSGSAFDHFADQALPMSGVWVDYRGKLRDQGAGTWQVGATGSEP